jgi:hypothetical protein
MMKITVGGRGIFFAPPPNHILFSCLDLLSAFSESSWHTINCQCLTLSLSTIYVKSLYF